MNENMEIMNNDVLNNAEGLADSSSGKGIGGLIVGGLIVVAVVTTAICIGKKIKKQKELAAQAAQDVQCGNANDEV